MADSARLVVVSTANQDEAGSIARALVEERLAACVNILGPVRSLYRWQGSVEQQDEFLMLIKTAARCWPALERRVRELHSYQVPEIIALPLCRSSRRYLAWLLSEVGPERCQAGGRSDKTRHERRNPALRQGQSPRRGSRRPA